MKKKTTICLNMIVKNEAKVIKRCLASVKGMMDYWCDFRYGVTDGTKENHSGIFIRCSRGTYGKTLGGFRLQSQ